MSIRRTRGRQVAAALLAPVVAVGVVSLGQGTATAHPAGTGPTLVGPVMTDLPVPAVPGLTDGASGGTGPAAGAVGVKDAPAGELDAHDLDLLTAAVARGDRDVTLIVATGRGRAGTVADDLRRLGGQVARQVDEVGYVRVRVPVGAVRQAAKLPGVAAVDLNESIPLPDPRPDSELGAATAGPAVAAPGPDTPADNPYLPAGETGAVAFRQAHPEWDGRGVTIGVMDSGVDLDHPALQTTTTGERKVADWFTATDPVLDADGTWRLMLTEVTGPTFTWSAATWTAPPGTWRINQFVESITTASAPAGDVNRDGDTTDRFGILYDPVTNDIRVDLNQNRDFTDDVVMRPYAEAFQVGHFGTDRPETPVREQVPFVVEFREDVDLSPYGGTYVGQRGDFVNIGIAESAHGSHVAGIAAANDMFGNSVFDGAAPGARLVSARACSWGGGCTAAALTDGMVELVVNRGVDVVNMSISGLPPLNDGNNARATLYNRLIEDYGVQLILSAGNSGPGLNTVGDPSVTANAITVAAGVSRETWLANHGSVVTTPYSLFNFSSRGPREDGGLQPNVTAPGSAISTTPLWLPGMPVPEAGYPLPPGYQLINGTSMAAPQTAGAVALLLSAAKATDRTVTPAALRRAIASSARWIDGVPAHGQGNGLLDVAGAWKLLTEGVQARRYTSSAPVCTALSGSLATPDRGTGIHNRCAPGEGGLRVGQEKTYLTTVTRTSGTRRGVEHRISWLGNDGTFSADRTTGLPLDRTIPVPVKVRATTPGVHSAIMRLDDPTTVGVDFEVLHTVVVAAEPKAPGHSFTAEGSVQRNAFASYFVAVPRGAAALQVNLSGIATGSQTRFIAYNPYGVPVGSTSGLVCFTNFSDPATCDPQERDYQSPLPGVWEIEVEVRRTSPVLVNPFQLTARVQGVAVGPATLELPSVTAGTPSGLSWTLTNTYGPVTVAGRGGSLGSAAIARPSIAGQATHTYQVVVPAGATRLDVAIGNPSDLAADLDLTVYRNGALVGRAADGDSEEAVTLVNPLAGTYEIRVSAFSVPAGTTAYDYRDVFYSASLGSVTVPATAVSLANGATATASGSVTALVAPAAGRRLLGELVVVTDEGAVVGRGNVIIGTVN